MKKGARVREQLMPWAGLVAGTLATGLAHQVGSDSVFNDCASASPVTVLIAALVGLAAVADGGLASWRVVKSRSEGPARRLVAIISVGVVALFVMAILLPLIASLVLPPCYR
jgi:uncharacterized membrane protein